MSTVNVACLVPSGLTVSLAINGKYLMPPVYNPFLTTVQLNYGVNLGIDSNWWKTFCDVFAQSPLVTNGQVYQT
jgi:hypothetical protein